MDQFVSKIINELIIKNPVFLILILFGIAYLLFYKKIIGFIGEHRVRRELKSLTPNYLILNNVTITRPDRACQIDHLIFSRFGIFVIETKNYHGFIQGNDYDKKWRVFNGRKYLVNNPIHQNYGHVQMLKEELNIEENKFISLVCLANNPKTNIVSNKVVKLYNLKEKINMYQDPILENYAQLYHYVAYLNRTDLKSKDEQIQYAKRIKEQKNSMSKSIYCPKCGGYLLERKGKYGTFYGCSNYPNCKYTKKMESKN